LKKRIIVYAGQYYDTETGLHYNYHRYYDPSLGRYLRADPSHYLNPDRIGIPFLVPKLLYNPQGLHDYNYTANNPSSRTDTFGLDSFGDDGWPGSGTMFPGWFEDEVDKHMDALVEVAKEDIKCFAKCTVFDVLIPEAEIKAVIAALNQAKKEAYRRAWKIAGAAAGVGKKMAKRYSTYSTGYAIIKCAVECTSCKR
jgi:RHS repeat-associated protein